MPPCPFHLVDVFGEAPFTGNPLAVITLDADRATSELQSITRWLNLSETAFLLPPTAPEADYRIRIFTLDRELPFAGHPTLGSCHAWLQQGGTPRRPGIIIQQCPAGLIEVRANAEALAFAAPALIRSGPVEPETLAEACSALNIGPDAVIAAAWIDNGPGWLGIQLADAAAVLAVEPARAHHTRIDIGLIGLHPPGHPQACELRALFTDHHGALIEDPVTGSLNASAAQWLIQRGLLSPPYLASQGTRLGRTGRIRITRDASGQVWVGGRTRTLVSGQTTLAPRAAPANLPEDGETA